MENLSDREREILSLVAMRLRNKEIAAHCGIAEKTVKNHVYNICRTLGIERKPGCQLRPSLIALWHDYKGAA